MTAGEILEQEMNAIGLNRYAICKITRLPFSVINAIIEDNMEITNSVSKKLSLVFMTPSLFWKKLWKQNKDEQKPIDKFEGMDEILKEVRGLTKWG